jgi:hypothetical protein
MHMNDRAVEDCLGDHADPARRCRISTLEHVSCPGRDGVVVSAQVDEVTVEPIDEGRHAAAQLHHALDDRIEDRL